jgi:protocatechuate 3,4-dioxygenase beta subunit
MKNLSKLIAVLFFLTATTNMFSQTAYVKWPLTSNQSPDAPVGNIQASQQLIGAGTGNYLLSIYNPYVANGQRLWTGNQGTGWIAGLPDYTRYIQFDASPISGNNFTVQYLSFNYSDNPLDRDFNILKSEVWYSTDGWNNKTQLNTTELNYLNTAVQTFSKSMNVLVQNGQTFSLRIYPYAPNGGSSMTQSWATHKDVLIEGTTSPVDLSNASICGIKFNDLNYNGRKDSGEPGLQGWTINLTMGVVQLTATTGTDGTYCFNNLPAGTYTLSETPQDGWQQTYPESPGTHNVILPAGQNVENVDFGNKQLLGSICGTKFNDLDGDGEIDEGEPGIQGWTINLTMGAVQMTAITGEDGSYCFNNLPAGTFTLSEAPQDGWQQTYPTNPITHTVVLSAGQNVENVDFGNKQLLGSICGIKFNDVNGDGRKDNGENGLSGWTITLSMGAVQMTATTGADGSYCFNNLPAGTYTLSETPQNGWRQTYPASPSTQTVTLAAGQNVVDLNFGNKRTLGSISGKKFNDLNGTGDQQIPNELGLPNWAIILTGPVSDTTTTDSDGYYHFNNLPSGTYTITEINQAGWQQIYPYSPGSYTIILGEGDIVISKDFANQLIPQQPGSICGIKFNDLDGNGEKDEGEQGIQGWTITLSMGAVQMTATTGADGSYCFNNLVAGTYTLSEIPQEGWQQTYPASPGTHTITLTPGLNLIGIDFGNKEILDPNCTDFENNSLSGWQGNNTSVSIQQNGNNHFIQTTDQAGASSFFNSSKPLNGNWTNLFANGCGSLCFDVSFLYGGNPYNGVNPPQTFVPYIVIQGGGFSAAFITNIPISVGDGWHSYCAPLSFLNSDGTLPSNSDGHWVMSVGTANDWNTLLTNVTSVRLPVDPTSYQNEKFGFDNICLNNTGDCDSPLRLGSICGIKIKDKNGDGIKDGNEDGLPNWTINLFNGTTTISATTDANGNYCFNDLPAGTYIVSEANLPEWRQIYPAAPGTHTVTLLPGDNVTNINFSNVEDPTVELGSICGIKFNDLNGNGVMDLNESRLPNWQFNLTGASTQTVTTDLRGNFCFTNLRPGSYTIREVIQNGWKPTAPDTTGTLNITLSSGQNLSEIYFGNQEILGSICGMKYNDLNGNGKWDAGEPGLPNWQITLSSLGQTSSGFAGGPTLTLISSATTDKNGNYCFTNIKPGNYLLGEIQQNGWKQTEPTSVLYGINLTPGQNIQGLNFGNKEDSSVRLGSICGIKFNDKNGNGKQDDDEPGIPDWQIQIGGQVDMTATTDKNGNYCFNNLPPGEYKVGEVMRTGWRQTLPTTNFYIIQLTSGQFIKDINFGNSVDDKVQLGSICGTKFNDKNRDGGQVSGELGIPNWTIYLEGPMNLTAVTDDNGNYCFYGLIPGTYTVREENKTGWRQTKPSSITYTLEVGNSDNFSGIDFGNTEDPTVTLGSICGIKFNDLNGDGDQDLGEPGIANWTINLTGTMNLTVRTDARGKFCFENLKFGLYTISELHKDGWRQTAPSSGSYTFELSEDNSHPDTFYFGNKYEESNIGCVNPPSGMVLWLPGDNNTNDISGFNNHGTVMFDLGYTAGKVNQAFNVNNFGYITVQDNSSLNFGKENFSIDAWVKTTDITNTFSIVHKVYVSSSFNITGYSFSLSQGKLRFIMGDGSTLVDKLETTIQIGDGLWHLVAVTIDRKNVTGGKMYIDGNLVLTFDPTSVSNSITNNSRMEIFDISNFYNHNGNQIDELEIFNRVITPAEIVSIFNAGSAGKCKTSVRLGSICGMKYLDKNGDGKKDLTEPGIADWQINIGGPVDRSIKTDKDGKFCFDDLPPGTYIIKEDARTDWVQTDPVSPDHYTVILTSGQNLTGYYFGNNYQPKPGCVNPPSNMVAWWSFDYSSRDARQDLTGFNNFGTMVNGPLQVAGKVAGALQFDGVDDYVEVADHSELNFGTDDFTFDAWIKTSENIGVKQLVSKRSSTGYGVFLNSGYLALTISAPSIAAMSWSPSVFVADGNWHHIAVTVSRTNKQGIVFYLDGVATPYGDPTPYQGSLTNSVSLMIGAQQLPHPSFNFKGILDEIELFKRVLTQAEVLAIYNAGSAGKCKPTGGLSSVFGHVFHDLNSNSLDDLGDRPLTNWTVFVNGPTIATTYTDVDGNFGFVDLKPGNYTISVAVQTGWSYTKPIKGNYTFEIGPAQSIDGLHFGLANDPCLSGLKTWSPLGSGVNGTVYALATDGTNLYAGGAFSSAGGVPANNIARWNGSSWSDIGGGINGTVYALKVVGNKLYVGGSFNLAGNVSAKNIAMWDGSWHSLGDGTNGVVMALEVIGTNLFAGGNFTMAGLGNASCIARWDITSSFWMALGAGVTPQLGGGVFALVKNGTDLFVGGSFWGTGGAYGAWHIVKLNSTNSSWSPMGSGLGNGKVLTLAIHNGELYAGGGFQSAGNWSNVVNYITKWDNLNSVWLPLGSGMGWHVHALKDDGSNLYAGGSFSTANSISVHGITYWDETNWIALGAGVSGNYYPGVFAIEINNDGLYVGGRFSSAGNVYANNIARYSCSGNLTSVGDDNSSNIIPQQFQLSQNYPNPFNPTTTIRYDVSKAGYVKISVYDILGREIRSLLNEDKTPGVYEVKFDGKNLASGIYFYIIRTEEFTQSKKMILMK